MAKKGKQKAWFVKTRGSFLPRTWQGILIYLCYVAYLIFALVEAINTQSSVARAILFIVPQWVAAIVVVTWLANNHS